MKRITNKVKVGIAFGVCLLIAQAGSATLIIDTFDEYQKVVVSPPVGSHNVDETVSSAATMLGGYRDIDVYLGRTKGAGDIVVETTTEGANGVLGYVETSNNGGGLWVTWDGKDTPNAGFGQVASAGLGGVNFAVGGATRIEVGFYSLVPGSSMSLSLWSEGVEYSQTQSGLGNLSQVIKFNYSDFKNGGTSITDAQLHNIGAVQLGWSSLLGGYGSTANFDFVQTGSDEVPEPGTVLLLGGSLLGLCVGAFKRLHRKV